MSFLKITVDELKQYTSTDKNVIGATTDTSLRRLSFLDKDATTIYVSGMLGDDINPGTKALPVKTIENALLKLKPEKYIHILDDDTDYEFLLANAPVGLSMQSELGEKPKLVLKVFDQEFAGSTGVTYLDRRDHLVTFDDRVLLSDEGNGIYVWDGTTLNHINPTIATRQIKKSRLINKVDDDTHHDVVVCLRTSAGTNKESGLLYYIGGGSVTLFSDYGIDIFTDGIWDFTLTRVEQLHGTPYKYTGCFILSDIRTKARLHILATGTSTQPDLDRQSDFSHVENLNVCDFFRDSLYIGADDGLYFNSEENLIDITTEFNLTERFTKAPIDCPVVTCISPYYDDQSFDPVTRRATNTEYDRLYVGNKDGKIYEYDPIANKWSFLANIGHSIIGMERKRLKSLSDCLFVTCSDVNTIFRINLITSEVTMMSTNTPRKIYEIKFLESTSDLSGFVYTEVQDVGGGNADYFCFRLHETIKSPGDLELNGLEIEPSGRQFSGFWLTDTSGYFLTLKWCTIKDLSSIMFCDDTNNRNITTHDCLFDNCEFGITLINAEYTMSMYDCVISNTLKEALKGDLVEKIRNTLFYNCLYGIYNQGDETTKLEVLGCIFLDIVHTGIYCEIQDSTKSYLNCFYRCGTNETFTEINETNYPNIYQAPLLKNILSGTEDYHLLMKILGAEFDSPCVMTGSATYVSIDSGTINSLPYQTSTFDISNGILGGVYFTISNLTGTSPNVQCELQEWDGLSWVGIDSVHFTANATYNLYFLNTLNSYSQMRLEFTLVSGTFTSMDFTSFYWTRDIGVMNTIRTLDTDYNSLKEITLSYSPRSLTYKVEKSDENIVSDLEGRKKVLARPVQNAIITLNWDTESEQKEQELYELALLADLNKYKLKVYFQDLIQDTDYSAGTGIIALQTIKSNASARVFFNSQYIDVNEQRFVLTDSNKEWDINCFKGFFIKLTSGADTYYKRIIFNDSTNIWIQDDENEISIGSWDYEIQYFYCILGFTSLELVKQFYNRYKRVDDYLGYNVTTLEFHETD